MLDNGQPRLFPKLVEPLDPAEPARPVAERDGRVRCDWLKRRQPPVQRINLHEARPQLTPEVEAWHVGLHNAETRRAYRRDALFLMRRLGLDTEPKLVCLERRNAVRYRDLLQALVSAGDCSAGLARRRMAAALSLYDHLQRQYLVLVNPFAKLRRPRQDGGDG